MKPTYSDAGKLAWYQKQTHYVKISERSNENGIYREA